MSRIIISSGHTQSEPGAISGDLREVDITKKISSKVVAQLREKGIITLSVPSELDLTARIDWINKSGYTADSKDLCIEFHINEGGKTGLEGWYKEDENDYSKSLTEKILEFACKKTSLINEGAKEEKTHPLKSLAFLSQTKPIASIVECLYIDNPEDQKFLRDDNKLDELCKGIADGILTFLDPDYKAIDQVAAPKQPAFGSQSFADQFNQLPRDPYKSFADYNPASPWDFGGLSKPAPAGQPQKAQTREDRKVMIQELYKKLLGREVSEQDSNYFLNLGLSEEQMSKRIIDSQEHADIIKNAQEYQKIKPEHDQLLTENERLKNGVKDKDAIIERQNKLISMKSVPVEQDADLTPNITTIPQAPKPQRPVEKQSGFFDRLLKKLNDIFE